ncbi:multiple sugar transport system permease protein [Arthrobacter sp. PvP102]|uniref:carbohydrate ABC transporter permease n=1 Tax=unclassified Arthrobacter TaxID=235627 RepID=UPI001AE96392|nr:MULTISPECIES: carbohydrate ABC transporter permease [unclassified Arthrobacter]MBP1232990.1 multiple sugar transport system permease protein [Arthrobacter sp. PvP103]MBP1238125.1 multiple sugar transport system permease protein [Arthrobacter sp. PvP102]
MTTEILVPRAADRTPDQQPRKNRRKRFPAGRVFSRVGVVLVGAVFFFPFIWMFASSLKPTSEIFSTGSSFFASRVEWSNYVTAWTAIPFGRIILNSFLVATAGALLTTVVSLLSAYAFARLQFKHRDKLFLVFLGTLVLPQEVLVIPLYIMMNKLDMVNSLPALIVPFAFGAFGAFLIRQFLLALPIEFEEAARIDGAGSIRILWSVILPLVRAPLAVVAVFSFIDYWSSFLWPLVVINDVSQATIPLGLSMFSGERGTDWGPLMAAATVAVIPSLLIVVLLQRQLVKGVSMGGFGGR